MMGKFVPLDEWRKTYAISPAWASALNGLAPVRRRIRPSHVSVEFPVAVDLVMDYAPRLTTEEGIDHGT